jgi:hypothetical protein
MSGSRFLRPKLSRFFNQVARKFRRPISRFLAHAALPQPLPGIPASRFLAKPQTSSTQTATEARTPSGSRLVRPKPSRFINQVAKVRQPISRFMARAAALLTLPAFFSSRFFTKPPTPPRQLRRDWPRKP